MIQLRNHKFRNYNQQLSSAFKNDVVKDFLHDLLKDLEEDAYSFKDLLKNGHQKFYDEIIADLSKSYRLIKIDKTEESVKGKVYLSIQRCIDDEIFSVGDVVLDKNDKHKSIYTIGRIYDDERGLHIRLDIDDHGKQSITWRELDKLEQVKPF